MPHSQELSAVTSVRLPAMRARFQAIYSQQARFREDAELVEALAREAEPVLEVLASALAPGEPMALHEGYALLTLLARHAASLGATPGVALTLGDAIAGALRDEGVEIAPERQSELALVAVEGYCAARDERSTRLLRECAAERQVAVELGQGCVGIFLAGCHDEADLTPTLERFARDLLRGDTRSCLLDVHRLEPIHEDLARALGRFCAQAATLGVCCFVIGAPPTLAEQFERWSVTGGPTLLVDDLAPARHPALAALVSSCRTGFGAMTWADMDAYPARPTGPVRRFATDCRAHRSGNSSSPSGLAARPDVTSPKFLLASVRWHHGVR